MADMGSIFRRKRSEGQGDHDGAPRHEGDYSESVLKALMYGDVDDRWNAIRAVGELGDAFIEPLITALRDDYWIIRREAANTLVSFGAPAVMPLIFALDDTREDTRQEVMRALTRIGPQAMESMLLEATHDRPLIRRGIVETLGNLHDPRATDPLIRALCDDDRRVREEAARALGKAGDPKAIGPLISLLNDPYGQVRNEAVRTIVSLGQPAISPLIEALVSEEAEVPQRAAFALVQIGRVSVGPLIEGLSATNPATRKGSAGILGHIRDKTAIPALIGTLNDPDRDVRREIIKALAELGAAPVGPLIEVFRTGEPLARYGAMEALWMIGAQALPPLRDALADDNPDVRKRTALLLGETGDASAIEALNNAMRDRNAQVRRAAFWAIEMIERRMEEAPTPEQVGDDSAIL